MADKKTFVAVGLCVAIYLVWQNVYLNKFAPPAVPTPSVASTANGVSSESKVVPPVGLKSLPVLQATKGNEKTADLPETVALGDSDYSVTVNTKGGVVSHTSIKEYRGRSTEILDILISGGNQLELSAPTAEWGYLGQVVYRVESSNKESVVLSYQDDNVSIRRTYKLNAKIFSVDHELSLQFKKVPPSYVFLGLRALKDVSKEHSENERRELFFNKTGAQDKWTVGDISAVKEDLGDLHWFGFSSRYFLNALVDNGSITHPQFRAAPVEGSGLVAADMVYKVSGPSFQISSRLFYGPKDIEILKSASDRLGSAVDFGWFTVIAYPLLKALKWFYLYIHNFGVAIILLTVLVKMITYPLTYKSMKSMKEMQRIQPQLAKLREKYKDDKEKLNLETLQLMKANGYNPASGCFPILIQMPIFIALYNVLYGAVDLYGQPFFGWIHDLSAKDPYFVTPVLLGLMMFLQQKLTPQTATDPAQQRMMMFMPLVFSFMMLWLPAGLTLYMLVNSVVSIAQQFWLNRVFAKAHPSAT